MKKYTAFIIIACLFASTLLQAQTRIRVNNTPGIDADYSDLQEAITNAGEGDIIYIESSGIPYAGSYHVDEPYMTLIGPGYFLSANDSTQANKSPVMIENLYIDETATGTIVMGIMVDEFYVNAGNVKITRNHIYRVNVSYSSSATDLNLYCNYITYEVYVYDGKVSSGGIYNNIFKTNGRAISCGESASLNIYNNVFDVYYGGTVLDVRNASIKNNIIYNSFSSYQPFIDANPANGNNVAYNVICQQELSQFPNNVWDVAIEDVVVYTTGGPEKKYLLPDGSPAIGAGENGVDCGIFGTNTPYVYSGLPPIPHIFESNIPVSGSSSSGLQVHIKAKTQN